MAGSVNKVFLMGNLTRDVEVKHISPENAVAHIGLAVNRRFRTREGEQREETTFVDCEAWGKTGEIMSQYLSKGQPVFIEGRLKLDQWQDREGNNRSKLKVVVDNFQFVGSKGDSGGGSGGGRSGRGASQSSQASHTGQPTQTGGGYAPLEDDDIPF